MLGCWDVGRMGRWDFGMLGVINEREERDVETKELRRDCSWNSETYAYLKKTVSAVQPSPVCIPKVQTSINPKIPTSINPKVPTSINPNLPHGKDLSIQLDGRPFIYGDHLRYPVQ
jgi:hypothetical protein